MTRKRRTFSKEFKQEAIRLSESRPVTEVASSLGVSSHLIYKWRAAQRDQGADAFRGRGNRTEQEQEIYELKRRIARLEEEKEILKKASAYFAQHLR